MKADPISTRHEWEVLVDEAVDAADGYEASCPELDLRLTGPDKGEVVRAISRRIRETAGQGATDPITLVDVEALRDAEDAVAARAAEARYRALGPNELANFDSFVHPSEARQ